MFLTLTVATNAWGAEGIYKTALFGTAYNSKSVGSYTDSWSATNDGFTVNLTNANNNNNGWSYIKMGRKGTASTGTITTAAAIDKAVTKVILTIDAITSSNIISITLKSATTIDGTYTSVGTFTKSKGTQTVTVSSPKTNLFYQIEVICTSGSSNGLITISRVDYYADLTPTATYDVSWVVNGEEIDVTEDISEGSKVPSLPAEPEIDCSGKVFVGWSDQEVADGNKPSILFRDVANSPTITKQTTFYAVFAESGGSSVTTWSKTDISAIIDGDEVVVVMNNGKDYALYKENGTGSAPTATPINVSNNLIASPSAEIVWVIGKSGNDLTFYKDDTKNTWLYCTATNNGVRVGTNANKTFTIDTSNGYLKNTGTSRYIGIYNSQDWRCYTSTSTNIGNQTLAFYKKTTTAGYQNYTTSCTIPSEYTVTFNTNGHGTAPDPQTVASGQQATAPTPAPTATGYIFEGWFRESKCTNKFDFNTAITADITLYAKWTPITYTVSFDNNGGTGTMATQTFTYNQAQTLTANTFTRTGYTFNGWNTQANGQGTNYTDKQSVKNLASTNGATITLYAQWKIQTFTVTFNSNGGTGTMVSQPFTYNVAQNLTSNTFTRTGYTFNGWNTQANGQGTTYTDQQSVTLTTAGLTLYAQWKANTYTVEFNANGGTGSMSNQSFTYGQSQNLTANAFTCTNYAFKNWNTKADGSGTAYTDKQSVSNLTTTNGETVTLYAQWTPTYTITWLANEQEFHKQENAVEGTALDVPDSEPDAANYACDDKVFVGWTATPISGTTDDEPVDLFTTKTAKVEDAATTYYAVFATEDGGGVENVDATLSFESTAQRTEFSTSKQVWEQNGIILTNEKGSSTSNVADYANPARFYKSSKITVTAPENITKIVFTCNAEEYATNLATSIGDSDLASGTIVTLILNGTSDEYEVTLSGGQVRMNSLTVTYTTGSGTSYSDYTTTCVEVQKYNVTYNKGDGATGTEPTESPKAEGATFTLASADGLTKDGYSFAGWLCNHDSKTYNAGKEYTMPAEDVTFTAQWNELPKYTVTFYNKGKKHSEVAQTIANAPIECPTGLVACDGYTFVGWSTEELDGVSTFSKIEGEYTPTKNITLYAVYAEGNVTTNGWVKVTDLSTITEGTYALLSNNDYAFNGTINNNSDGEHTTNSFVFNGEGVASEAPSGTCEIELIASGDGFKMYSEGKGYLYAKAAKSGNLAWQQNENSFWSWDSTKDNWVYAENKAFLRSYNNTFRTYGTNNGNAIYFAKKNVTSFTTSPACDPMITIGSAEPVMVTSAKDIRVDAVQNITISATNLDQNADKAQVSIKIVSDNSAFKFKEVDANGDGQATPTWTGIANATFDKTLCVTYTPTKAAQEETATLTVTAYRHNGSTEYATATMQVRGRSLPEQFVLVANTGNGWVALPNTLGTSSSSSIPTPIAVEVDNDANPTSIPQAPSTTIYKAAARSSVNAVPTGLRFTTEAGGYLQASASETNIWLSSNNSENMQSWTLNSTDFVDYSIRVNNSAEGAYLNYNTTQKKIGNYKSDNKLRILPVGAICEQHAAPEDLELTSVYATSATIQWSAVSTATSGYEYRVGATGEWTKVGNITELELTGLTSLTNYIIYVRASVEGSAINCSYESEVEFTTLNCDDVPSDIHYASGANSVTVYWACEAATSTVSLYRDKEGLSLVETKTSVTSPCQFTGLDKFTTYYVQILAGGFCPSGMIQVSTEQLDLDVVEWMSDGVVVDVNTDETITVTLENEVQYGSGVGQVAEELFFSKYFEGSGNLKLLAIYNGTGKDVDLSTYSIKLARNGNATNVEKTYDLSLLGTIKRGQEIIFYTKPSSGEYPYNCSQSFLASKTNESGIDANPRWILCDNAAHNGITYETLDFSGDDPLLFYKGSALIDVFGVSTAADRPSKKTQCSGRSEESWSADEVTNMDYNKTAADFEGGVVPEGVDLLNPTITAYTARVIMFRKNTVTSGSAAVSGNETDFVTFASEWEARSVCKSGDDGNLTCGAYQELGKFDYADYYTKYETIAGEQGFDENARLEDGTIKIRIPNLSTYSCKNIKFNVKVGGVTINEVTKVPILIANEQSTNGGEVFTNLKTTLGTTIVNGSDVTIEPLTDEQLLEKCEVCDIVVLASGQLTHEAEGIDQFNDLTIYPEGVFHNTSEFNVNRLLIHAKKDDVGYAIIENEGVSLTTDAIAHTKRIDAQYWYAFSLPYDCNINEITQANGESMGEYGVHWGIQYYDGKRRQQEGTSANLGQSSKFWLPMRPNDKLNAYQGYLIALFDASVQKPTDMRTIYFPPAEENTYTESGSDSKQTNVYSWNVNLTCEKRHHGWNFTATPYISMFNPVAAGITDADLSNVLMTGTWDPVENEYEENEHVYVSIPTPNGGKYYNQHLASTKELLPFMAYFVQTSDPTTGDETKQLTYAKGGRELPAAAPARAAATAQRVLVELLVTAPDGQTDNTGVWVDENYVSEYELAADLTKIYVAGEKPQLYTLAANNEKMAYNALPDGAATNIPLGLYAPIAGDYNLSLNERMSRIAGAESVELIYNNAVVANLLFQDYTITANKGNVNGYSLCIRRRANVTTAVDNVTGSVITMIVNDGYISVLGVPTDATVYVYDMVGHLMEMQSANGNTVVNMPSVPQGVYNIVITNDKGSTTIKSFVK